MGKITKKSEQKKQYNELNIYIHIKMQKVYIVVTEEYFGGAETGNMKVFWSRENAEKHAKTISDEFERFVHELVLS